MGFEVNWRSHDTYVGCCNREWAELRVGARGRRERRKQRWASVVVTTDCGTLDQQPANQSIPSLVTQPQPTAFTSGQQYLLFSTAQLYISIQYPFNIYCPVNIVTCVYFKHYKKININTLTVEN